MQLTKPKKTRVRVLIQEFEGTKLVKGGSRCITVWEAKPLHVYGIIMNALRNASRKVG